MAAEWRKTHEITVEGVCPDPVTVFSPKLLKQLPSVLKSFEDQGFKAPTPIQAQSWPILFAGHDMVGIAKTGSGKTIAFIVPALQQILSQPALKPGDGPLCLVLAPTRELAQQIEAETTKVLPSDVRCTVVYGGVSKGPQISALKAGSHIVVATPGRLLDLMECELTNLNRVCYLVMDEADRMLDLGFEPQVRQICSKVPRKRQTLMFSATWPESVQNLASAFQAPDVVKVHVGASDQLFANSDVKQHFAFVRHSGEKYRELTKIMDRFKGRRILVFALYKKSVNFLETQLRNAYSNVVAISSDKTQEHREAMLDRFRKQKDCILVATDVAARGLDVKELDVVINYEFPILVDDYVHRIGRTGRAGAKGDAYTILAEKEDYFDGFAAESLAALLEQAGQAVPEQITALAFTVRNKCRVVRKKEKIPEFVALSTDGAAPKSTKFVDSDDEESSPPPAKAHRKEL